METIISILIFILGASIGSFLSVAIYRTHKSKKGIILSRSICPSCKKTIKWQHLIPIFSWIFLRGKCGYCRKKISAHYLLLELLTGTLFLITFLKFNFIEIIPSTVDESILSYQIYFENLTLFVFYAVIFSFLSIIFFYDTLYQEIPDRFSMPAIAIIIVANLFIIESLEITDMALGGAIIFSFFYLQYLISKGAWIGGGDLRMGVLMGVLLGFSKGLIALVLSYFTGFIFAIYLLLKGSAGRKTKIAFGPFLIIGIIVTIFYGTELLDWYLNDFLI